jgi:hypothetical protein
MVDSCCTEVTVLYSRSLSILPSREIMQSLAASCMVGGGGGGEGAHSTPHH